MRKNDERKFIVRKHRALRALPDWLKLRSYDHSIYDAKLARNRTIEITLDGELVGSIVCMDMSLFPDALIAVLHGQQAIRRAA